VVLANYTPEQAEPHGISTVGFNNSLGTVHAVRHLSALGHRRIAYLGGTPGWVDSLQRKDGFSRGLAEMQLPKIAAFIRDTDFSQGYDAGLAEMTDILAGGGAAPTAVVCASDDIAAGAMEAARLWGLQVPRDLSVIGYDDQRWCNFMTPKLTSVRHAGWDLGEHVGRTLLQQFDAPDTPPSHTILETRLVLRESTAPAPTGQ
jgi:LacI family transcriptional regulator